MGEIFEDQKFRKAMIIAGDRLAEKGFEKEYAMRIGEKDGEYILGSIVSSGQSREVLMDDVMKSDLGDAKWVATMHSHPDLGHSSFCVYSTGMVRSKSRFAWLSEGDVHRAKQQDFIIGVVVPNANKSIQIAYVQGDWKGWKLANPGSNRYSNSSSYYYDKMLLQRIR